MAHPRRKRVGTLARAQGAGVHQAVGRRRRALRGSLKVARRAPLQVGHDEAKEPAWDEHSVGITQGCRDIGARQMLQHVTAIDAARAAIGDGEAAHDIARSCIVRKL